MICSKFITFAVTKTTVIVIIVAFKGCDLLKIHYLCGDKDNQTMKLPKLYTVVICSKFITFAVTKTTRALATCAQMGCDLLKIHYLCGDKDNPPQNKSIRCVVVICSKFITFAVTKTTSGCSETTQNKLWFAQNSLPLRWQRQHTLILPFLSVCCDLLKIHYLCGDKDNS